MPLNEPQDVLAELVDLAAGYRGSRPWLTEMERVPSNPIKLRTRYEAQAVFSHTEPRTELSAREGAALLYALQLQQCDVVAGNEFSRTFLHHDGQRELVLENGVVRDLLAVGVLSLLSSPDEGRFVVTGLGRSELARCFPARV